MQTILVRLILSLACITSLVLGFALSPRSGRVSVASSVSMAMYKTKAERDAAMVEKKAKEAVNRSGRKTAAAEKVSRMIV